MGRGGEERLNRGLFHHLTAIQHDDLAAEAGDHAKVMGDQDRRHAEIALQVAQKVHDLGLHGDIKRGGRLIGNQQVGLAQKAHRDHDALAHAAGKLMRIQPDATTGVGDFHGVQHADTFGKRLRPGQAFVVEQGFHHLVADPHIGVERGHRVLKHHRDMVGADGVQGGDRRADQFGAVEFDRAARGAVLGQKAEDGEGKLAFARAGFAHNAKGLPAFQRKADAVDGVDGAVAGGKADGKVLDVQHGHVSGPWGQAHRASRRRRSRRRTWW